MGKCWALITDLSGEEEIIEVSLLEEEGFLPGSIFIKLKPAK